MLEDDCYDYDDDEEDGSYDGYSATPTTAASQSMSPNPSKILSISPSTRTTQSMIPSTSTRPSLSPSTSTNPTASPTYNEKKIIASDGESLDYFGASCSMTDVSVVIGAYGVDSWIGAAYLISLSGTEIKKLTPNNGESWDEFGHSVSMDEKVVVGSLGGKYVEVFSHDGIYERTITCNDCTFYEDYGFGFRVATLGDKIVIIGYQDALYKLFIYTTGGQKLKELEQGSDSISDVAISNEVIVTTALEGKTVVYSNSEPDFPKMTEIDKGGISVSVSGNRLVIGDWTASAWDGAAWIYNTNGTPVKTLERQDSTSGSHFGHNVAITGDKIIVGAERDDEGGFNTGSVFIYSAINGEFIEKVLAPDGKDYNYFGYGVCASDSYYMVGATGVDDNGGLSGAAYLFNLHT